MSFASVINIKNIKELSMSRGYNGFRSSDMFLVRGSSRKGAAHKRET